jgi:UDP:flavonoid glycosyltransferase YjiC (YdhE family)
MRAGRPTLVLPFGQDQHDHGWRVERAGVGLTLPRRRATPERLCAAIRACLASTRMARAATALARRLSAEEAGEVVAARAIREAFGSAHEKR